MADYQRKRKDSLSGAQEAPGPPINVFLQKLVSSIFGGPAGALDPSIESAYNTEELPGPHAGENDVKLGVVNPITKALRKPAQLAAMDAIGEAPVNPLNRVINQRDNLYHATTLEHLNSILKEGIRPSGGFGAYRQGVSMSRVPSIPSIPGEVTLVLDKNKVGRNAPLMEGGFGKPVGYDVTRPNYFEYENRTYGDENISPNAIKQVLFRGGNPGVAQVFKDELLSKGIPAKRLFKSITGNADQAPSLTKPYLNVHDFIEPLFRRQAIGE